MGKCRLNCAPEGIWWQKQLAFGGLGQPINPTPGA